MAGPEALAGVVKPGRYEVRRLDTGVTVVVELLDGPAARLRLAGAARALRKLRRWSHAPADEVERQVDAALEGIEDMGED